jgi:hypothetical protein
MPLVTGIIRRIFRVTSIGWLLVISTTIVIDVAIYITVTKFDVRFIVSVKLVDKLLSDLANLSKSQKIEYMMLHFWFMEIPPKDFVPRPCILHTIEQNNSLCSFDQ